jgi:hypothetical protein
MPGFQEHLRSYFANTRLRLLADAAAAGTPHSGLAGSHRESLIRDYLATILPRRLDIGRGIVFGVAHRSREADVVLWDSSNYPCLRLTDHQLFFAESARMVLEAKSRWSADEFRDILDKCRQIRDIVPVHAPNIADDIAVLQLDLQALKHGLEHQGMLLTKPHIATAAFVFLGGQSFARATVDLDWIENADDAWPDAMILLEPGMVVIKHYVVGEEGFSGNGYLEFIRAGEDGLFLFTAALMAFVNDRCVQIEDSTYLSLYSQQLLDTKEREMVDFRLRRPPPSRRPIWP